MNKIIFLVEVLISFSLLNANNLNETTDESIDILKAIQKQSFEGKVVLVTGSSSGIGRAIVKLFSVFGAQVVVTGNDRIGIERVAQECRALSPQKLQPLEVFADVTKSDDLKRLINETIKQFGRLDVLVNNAGVSSITSISFKNFMENFDLLFNTNVRSYAQLIHLAVPYLKKTNGSIIQTSSVLGFSPVSVVGLYSMTKVAVEMMSRCLALELGPLGIRVNSISPGFIPTDIYGRALPFIKFFKDKIIDYNAIKRFGSTLDLAKGVLFLASNDASFTTGANLVIDGGLIHNMFPSPTSNKFSKTIRFFG